MAKYWIWFAALGSLTAGAVLTARALTVAAVPGGDITVIPPDREAPLVMRVSLRAARGNYYVPFGDLTFSKQDGRLRPAIVWLPGCGYGVVGRDIPKYAAVFSVEDQHVGGPNAVVKACSSGDADELRSAYLAHLTFALAEVRKLPWVDHDRILVIASGEAAPVVAESKLAGMATKLLIADPCRVGWRNMDTEAPSYVFWSAQPYGLTFSRPAKVGTDRVEALRRAERDPVATATSYSTTCEAQPRPALPSNYTVHLAQGRITAIDMPVALQQAQRSIMQRIWPTAKLR